MEALTPVIVAASKCHFPSDDRVIERVNVLFDEFDQLYQVTGDPDFCPNGTICNSLNSIYARMNRHQMNFGDFTKRTTLLLQRMEEYNIKFKDPRDKTSAFNRILHAAESQLPDNPIGEPVETREIFILVLNIFKKFHFAADGDEDADLYSEDDCNLDVQQEMEVNESNAESQDVILTPCPCICIRISVFVFVCANLYLCICVFVYLYLYLCICICMCEFVVVYLYFCVLFVHT